jgi:hypothetical protein
MNIFKKKHVYSKEEIGGVIAKAISDTEDYGCFMISNDVPDYVIDHIHRLLNIARKERRQKLWKRRRRNRRWV